MANKVYSFADLKFCLHDIHGVHGLLKMDNGVYISCVFFEGSYGYREGLWEIWARNIEPDPVAMSIHDINAWMAELSMLTPEQVKSMEEALDEAKSIWETDALDDMLDDIEDEFNLN
jgi:hypothetical protein